MLHYTYKCQLIIVLWKADTIHFSIRVEDYRHITMFSIPFIYIYIYISYLINFAAKSITRKKQVFLPSLKKKIYILGGSSMTN